MFFKQVRSNAAKNRKNNGLFFSSLVVAIVAFYTLLSLSDQDVMRFLKTIESDAVSKLMLLIPIVYMISLFFVFFLVYFAYRYQLDNRKKEFGLYLMLGMKRSALFAMLMSETIWNSLISILLGLPIALLLTEGISLTTAKLVGLGIIGHRISFSISAVLGTVVGFIAVQMIAMLFLSAEFSRKEPMELLQSDSPEKQVSLSGKKGWLGFALGLIFLVLAYAIGVTMLRSFDFNIVALILALGGSGTFLLYHGMGVFIGHKIQRKSPTRSGLFTFTGRQIQENVLHQYRALAISSLLLLMALACVSFGIGVASGRGSMDVRTVDFSIDGSEQEVRGVLDSEASKSMVSVYYPMFLSSMNTNLYDKTGAVLTSKPNARDFSWAGFSAALANLPETDLRNNMIEIISGRSGPYLISETSYNELLQAIGKEQIRLGKNQVALYTSMKDSGDFINNLDGALKLGAYIEVDGQKYELLPGIYQDNVVADRKITLYSALIVSDEDYQNWVSDSSTPFCWNVLLSQKVVNEKGLMQAIQLMEQNLAGTGLEYESYIGGIGRNLFYTVAASYLTIYLGILFMVIANTVIGLKYLIQQRANKHRYLTLLMLGANENDLCKSARAQIRIFFAMVLGIAVCSSAFAIWSMFTSFLKLPAGMSFARVILLAGIAFILFIVIEFIYIKIIEHTSNREIQTLQVTDRGNAFE
ncbi:FtsX-like permease family protein [Dehalobacterium formicoaceticum]|uniref:FtsX-like permease family protein n=1 Tax=Dehalobacterium formicoaceticum TaxID=51515 RepID=A0ABT1Y6H6_9FIRM|nr:FtsX-like permease family protein [Dehalobacterium formicoaceticum]MCR6546479.1 FtsX-like permease family protein [Dehalobacterium formicoaceticum]